MAKKSLGYVELEWVCPTCNTRNRGSQRTCQGCGSPQPPDVQFVTPGQAVVAKDEETVAKATAGPDIHCPYCDARNPAGAKVCKQCGGDLTGAQARTAGTVLSVSTQAKPPVTCPTCGAKNDAAARLCKNCGAPLPVVATAPVPVSAIKKGGGGCLWIVVGLALVIALGVAVMIFMGGGERTTVTAQVRGASWQRSVQVLGLMPVQRTAWRDQIPPDAAMGQCVDEVRREVDEPVPNSREVCGTPYAVDQGTGFAEMVQDCVYQVIEQRCTYTVNEWQPVDSLVLTGEGLTPNWPQLTGGNQRPGERAESYQCVFEGDGATYTYTTRDFAAYQACTTGAVWTLVVDESGRVVSASPQP